MGKPLGVAQQAADIVKLHIDTNNSVHKASDSLLSMLEGGNGSLTMRNFLDHRMNMLSKGILGGFDLASSRDEFRGLSSAKDKVAYFVGKAYEVDHTAAGRTHVSPDEVKQKLHQVLAALEKEVYTHQNMSEKWICRHAAYSNVISGYTPTERNTILGLCQKLTKIAKDNHADDVVSAMHFSQESDVQKIVKIEEAIAALGGQGIVVEQSITDTLTPLQAKLKPLEDLDKSYKHLVNLQNMTYQLGHNVRHGMIRGRQKKKLFALFADLGKKPEDFMIPVNSNTTAQDMLADIHAESNHDNFQAALQKNAVTKDEFNQRFLSYVAFRNIDVARSGLESAKKKAFGDNVKRYDMDVQQRRGSARAKILAVEAAMTPTSPYFASEDDYELVSNYFNKFKSLFSADPGLRGNNPEYMRMRKVLTAMIRRKAPALAGRVHLAPRLQQFTDSGKLGRGMATSKYKWLQRLASKEAKRDANLFGPHTDDAEVFATLIMSQANVAQALYYKDKSQTIRPESSSKVIAKHIGKTERLRQGVASVVGPKVRGTLRIASNLTGGLANGALRLTAGTAKVLGEGLGSFNKRMEKRGGFWKVATWPFSWTLEKSFNGINNGALYLNEGRKDSHKFAVEQVREISGDQNVTHATDGIGKMINTATSRISKPIAAGGDLWYNTVETKQNREVLDAFYKLAAADDTIAEAMQTMDLANMLNPTEYGPGLFEEDGRVPPVSIYSPDKPKDDAEGVAGNIHKVFTKQADDLKKGLEATYKTMTDAIIAEPDTDKKQILRDRLDIVKTENIIIKTIIDKIRTSATTAKGATTDADIASALKPLIDALEKETKKGSSGLQDTIIKAEKKIGILDGEISVLESQIDQSKRDADAARQHIHKHTPKGSTPPTTDPAATLTAALGKLASDEPTLQKKITERDNLIPNYKLQRGVLSTLKDIKANIDPIYDPLIGGGTISYSTLNSIIKDLNLTSI